MLYGKRYVVNLNGFLSRSVSVSVTSVSINASLSSGKSIKIKNRTASNAHSRFNEYRAFRNVRSWAQSSVLESLSSMTSSWKRKYKSITYLMVDLELFALYERLSRSFRRSKIVPESSGTILRFFCGMDSALIDSLSSDGRFVADTSLDLLVGGELSDVLKIGKSTKSWRYVGFRPTSFLKLEYASLIESSSYLALLENWKLEAEWMYLIAAETVFRPGSDRIA